MKNQNMLLILKKLFTFYFLLFLISNFPKTLNGNQKKSLLKKMEEFSEPEYKFFVKSFIFNITEGMKIFK